MQISVKGNRARDSIPEGPRDSKYRSACFLLLVDCSLMLLLLLRLLASYVH